jgi:mono/diheme cytochrome c family protein
MHRSILRLALALMGVSSLAGCETLLYGDEHPQVMERWALNYSGECSSWLHSSVSGKKYCASPPIFLHVELPEVDEGPRFDETKIDEDSLYAAGEQVYSGTCAACHQAEGQGLEGMYPPLAGSGDYYGTPENMANIIVHGLAGEIVVQGKTYNGAMPAQGALLSDYEIAAAATYVRGSWGNDDGMVLPDVVKAAR